MSGCFYRGEKGESGRSRTRCPQPGERSCNSSSFLQQSSYGFLSVSLWRQQHQVAGSMNRYGISRKGGKHSMYLMPYKDGLGPELLSAAPDRCLCSGRQPKAASTSSCVAVFPRSPEAEMQRAPEPRDLFFCCRRRARLPAGRQKSAACLSAGPRRSKAANLGGGALTTASK